MSRFGGDEIIIRQVQIQRTGRFHDIFNRSFELATDDDRTYDRIRERLVANGPHGRLNEESFRGVAASILVPNAEVNERRDLIRMPDGWDRERCRFSMEVQVRSRTGDDSTYYFQGFTDHYGVSGAGENTSCDDNMVFYINGFVRVSFSMRDTNRGRVRVPVVKQMAQVIDGQIIYEHGETTRWTRPADVYCGIQQRFLESGFSGAVGDSRTMLNSPADSLVTSRQNGTAGRYLSSVLGAYQQYSQHSEFGVGTEDIVSRAQSALSADDILLADNVFLAQLGRVRGLNTATSFTLRDLEEIDPECGGGSGRIASTEMSRKALAQLATTDNVSDWRSPTRHGRWATQIASGLSAILMSHYHTAVKFTISNENMGNKILLQLEDAAAVAEELPDELIERMLNQIEDLFYDLSGGNIDDFSVSVSATSTDQSFIRISVDGERREDFYVPSFADSLMSVFYTRDSERFHRLSSDIEGVFKDMQGEISGTSSLVNHSV